MVEDYISRKAALSAQNKSMNLAECRTRLERLPAADVVERKKGKWEHLSGDEWICNQCGFVLSTEGSWEHPLKDREKFYCEHCGADMREDAT